jgi:hypothetical protein
MAYIGRGIDKLSNIEKLDVITFDGSSSYSLTKNSVAFTPSSANSLQVSIDGVVQAGNFTVSGSTIDFGTAVASTSTNDFIFHYGTGLITTPADGTVGLNQLSATGTKDATTFLRGDNTFASAGGFTLGTPVTASGSNVTFSSIPSTARLIIISFSGLSHNHGSNADLKVILGDSGGLETSGYTSNVVYTGSGGGIGGANYTNGHTFYYSAPNSTTVYGIVFITAIDTTNHIYAISSQAGASNYIGHAAGSKSLSSVLTQIQVQSSSGALDAGTLNIMYL